MQRHLYFFSIGGRKAGAALTLVAECPPNFSGQRWFEDYRSRRLTNVSFTAGCAKSSGMSA